MSRIKFDKKIVKYRVLKPEAEKPAPREGKVVRKEGGGKVVRIHEKLERPEVLIGSTYKIKTPVSDHAMYLTINDIVMNEGTEHEHRRPFEIFINSKNLDHFQWIVALTRVISAVFRKGGEVAFLVEELKAVFDPRGGSWVDGKYVPSLLAAIGDVIERHMIAIVFLPDPRREQEELQRMAARKVANLADGLGNGDAGSMRMRHCPKCNSPTLIRQEGCDLCTSCGYSKCA